MQTLKKVEYIAHCMYDIGMGDLSPFGQFVVTYFVLLCVSLVMYVNSIQRFKQHPRISLYTILILSNALLLAIMEALNNYAKAAGLMPLAMISSYLGYCLRPICIYFFILMSGEITIKTKWFFTSYILLIINAVIYLFLFIPATKEAVVFYSYASDGSLNWHGGPLRYSSHIVSALYLLYLLYISFAKINSKHLGHGLTILSCAAFVVLAVVIETFLNQNSDIYLLNSTIAVSTMVYYLYLYIERTQIDTLTGLFNRETYYRDMKKMERSITGVIQVDMNGLKYLNDHYGHFEGDKALAAIARVLSSSVNRKMYVYRLGGDEYIVLGHNVGEAELSKAVARFKENLAKTPYYCAIGSSFRVDKNEAVENLIKRAEEKMYQDKEEFYKNAKFERRKA